jgi:hypothetical protein
VAAVADMNKKRTHAPVNVKECLVLAEMTARHGAILPRSSIPPVIAVKPSMWL